MNLNETTILLAQSGHFIASPTHLNDREIPSAWQPASKAQYRHYAPLQQELVVSNGGGRRGPGRIAALGPAEGEWFHNNTTSTHNYNNNKDYPTRSFQMNKQSCNHYVIIENKLTVFTRQALRLSTITGLAGLTKKFTLVCLSSQKVPQKHKLHDHLTGLYTYCIGAKQTSVGGFICFPGRGWGGIGCCRDFVSFAHIKVWQLPSHAPCMPCLALVNKA